MSPLHTAADQLHDIFTDLNQRAHNADCQAIADALYATAANMAWSISTLYASHDETIMATLWDDQASRCAIHIASIA
jgi:hypothetical protein